MSVLNKEIPIFFSTDDNYAPFLDVAIRSLIINASKDYNYRIIVLNTGLNDEVARKIKLNENDRFKIDLCDISADIESIKDSLKDVYHFSVATYYRLFISSLFPQYDKIVYLDCDLVLLGDVSELYNVDMGDNIIAAADEEYVQNTPEFRKYAEVCIGVDPDKYVNAGVLVMNLDAYRKNDIEGKFLKLITEYDFELLDPDQAYLNYLCYNKIYALPNGWNKEPMQVPLVGKKNIVHYALYKKPWQYSDVEDGEYFWEYAKPSPFYELINSRLCSFTDEERAQKDAAGVEIIEQAKRLVASDYTFFKKLGRP